MKKFVSLLLTVVMFATMLTVFAVPTFAEGETESAEGETESTEAEIVTKPESATWLVDEGDNHVWYELSEDGKTLTIGGEGAMPDYGLLTFENRPWHSAAETITAVEIASGVKNIGNNAFYNCTNLASVTIPESVKSIGEHAFQICTNLASVTIPKSVESIGQSAFAYCGLTSVTIPEGVTSIAYATFGDCQSLASVTIPKSVESIGEYAFQRCTSLTSITIPSDVTNIDKNVFQSCKSLKSVTVKASTPPTLASHNAFPIYESKFSVCVPFGTVGAYQRDRNWNRVVSNTFEEAYMVDNKYAENGTVTVDKDWFPTETYKEETVTVTVTPAEGYQLKADSLLVKYKDENDEEKTAALTQDETDTTKYTFTMPPANVTVTAEFEEIPNESETDSTSEGIEEGSTISNGNVWIIAVVAVVAVVGVATLIIVKKKKKPALAGGAESDE